jgi:preprotein translocase subunit SecG
MEPRPRRAGRLFIQVTMQTILIVIHLFVAISLTIVVLLQRSEGGALGMGGGGQGGLGGIFSPRGAANTLTRTTAILGMMFFLTSLALTWLALTTHQSRSILDSSGPPGSSAPVRPATPPVLPSAPAPAPQAPVVPPSQ